MLVTVIPKVLIFMQVIGSFYMIYLAYQIYKMDTSKGIINEIGTFISGFLMQFMNPKVVLFTVTVITTYVLPYYQSMTALTLSIIVITSIGFLAVDLTHLNKHLKVYLEYLHLNICHI